MALNLYRPGDPGFAQEISAFNTAVTHRPDIAVGIASTEDAVEAVQLARNEEQKTGTTRCGAGPVRSGPAATFPARSNRGLGYSADDGSLAAC